MRSLNILSPCGILGYGFPKESFQRGLDRNPDIIAVDAGSTDAGPHKLGAGVGIVSRQATKKDLELILRAGFERKIPVIIGSAGGSGAKPHLKWTMDIIREVVREQGFNFKSALIYTDIDKDIIRARMKTGDVNPLGPVPELTEEALDSANGVVGQFGHEPIIKALTEGAQLIVCGRVYDPAIFAALPIMKGFDPGLAYHMGKIIECGALCAEPGTAKDCIMGYLYDDCFMIEPLNIESKCYTTSVAAHTLYEKGHPYHLPGPGHILDLSGCKFEQYSDSMVKVSGSKFVPSKQYTIKMEGASKVAYRTLVIAGTRDPIMIQNIEVIKEEVVKSVRTYFSEVSPTDYKIIFHLYGKNGVMGDLEPVKEPAHELGIVLEVVAKTQELANTICAAARSTLLHFGYEGRKATAGNLAFLYSPSDIEFGPVYKFTVYHLINVSDPCELCQIKYLDL